MAPVLWLIGVLLLYLAVGSLVVFGVLAARVRSTAAIALLVVGAVAGLAVMRAVTAPFGLLSGTVLSIAISVAAHLGLIRPKMTWHERKAGKELTRQTTLHMILLSGSAVFLIPFAWLLVTSLKEDEDMSQFPPTWIPRQQVQVKVDGKDAKLYTGTYNGQKVTFAGLNDLPNGDVHVRVISPAPLASQHIEFDSPAGQLKKIKHFAPVWKNYADAVKFLPPETKRGLVFVGNTLLLCVLGIIGTLLANSLVAFAFARLRWPGRDMCFVVLLATMMLPGAVTMMPVFLIFRWLGWIDTLKPLWVPAFFGGAFNVFLLRQFFMTIPNDLEEAARIDGCSYFGIYWRIMLPLIKPALAALTIMTFMGTWNNFMGPLIYINSPSKMPLAYALQLFQTAHGGEGGLMMAASTMVMLPVLALFFFTQRYFIEGITLTGIKG